jgi:UDP-glucose 4-epimerase
MSCRTALVTGAAGFLGGAICKALRQEGWRVAGFGHGVRAAHWLDEARGGTLDERALGELLQEIPVELVVHAAGGASVRRSWDDPALDFRRTVESSRAVVATVARHAPAAVIVFPSSAAVYGAAAGSLSETHPVAPVSPYGAHKAMAETLFLSAERLWGIRCAVIRYFSLYGRGLRKQLLWDLTQKLRGNPEAISLMGTGNELRDFLHVEDAAALAVTAATVARKRGTLLINGGTGIATSVADLAGAVMGAAGARARLSFTGAVPPGDPPSLVADTREQAALAGQPRRRLEDGIADYVEWAIEATQPLAAS